ncbi:MBL fold metallo-hydrolase [Nannocystis bainbridge]|uniref:MBL fold metallo-hydrolase n=1 Tax=Nannocystis bainbridge TaxID=2995303 RepID=A0ABT5EA17_9BACT|nr:MBL fold metallo-hydrolase [Nannocystis bainbridge]MDC0722699.1 MBL fold metallo-hydrolase [Nannocystis bainbridge]
MEVTFWGTRGSIPVSGPRYAEFGGNTPCLQISLESTTDTVILDSGSGIRELGIRLVQTRAAHSRCIHLFLTHAHWDHIQGFPFFPPAFMPDFRLHIYCTKDARAVLDRQMSTPFFPVGLDVMGSTKHFHHLLPQEVTTIAEATLRHIPLPHPQESTAFRVDERGKSIVFATDTEHAPDHINETLRDLAEGADVLIYDAQYTSEEYSAGKQGWGHSTFAEAVKLARAAHVGKLVLYSHDPAHDDEMLRKIEAAAQEAFPGTVAARDGMKLKL